MPQIWKDGHVSLGALWGLYSRYPYMPRLRDRRVLAEGVADIPMVWQIDAFALAEGHEETTGHYIGLWVPEDERPAPPRTDSLLLVRPEVAAAQREAEVSGAPGATEMFDEGQEAETHVEAGPDHPDVDRRKSKTRFFGVKTLNTERIAMDFKNIAEEILTHLRADTSTELTVRIEIEAIDERGFDESKVRTVSENARTLKIDQSGFEED